MDARVATARVRIARVARWRKCLTFAREWASIAHDDEWRSVTYGHARRNAQASYGQSEASMTSHNVREQRGITNNMCTQIAVNERSALR
jgi:hypothetical protein